MSFGNFYRVSKTLKKKKKKKKEREREAIIINYMSTI